MIVAGLSNEVSPQIVKFPMSPLKPGAKVMGTTIAELGNRSRPLDTIVHQKGGTNYILMNNSRRGGMKMSAGDKTFS